MALSCTRQRGEYITLRHGDDLIIPIRLHKLYLDGVGLRIPELEGLDTGPCEGQGDLYILDLEGEPLDLHLRDPDLVVSLSVREVRDSWARISVDAPRSVKIDKSGEHPNDQEDDR